MMDVALRRHSGRDTRGAVRHQIRPRLRRSLARSFEHAIRDARAPQSALSARIPVQRHQVLAARADIDALVARLRELDRPIQAEGMRLAQELLCDGEGPLYQWAEPGTLRRRVRVICEAMG